MSSSARPPGDQPETTDNAKATTPAAAGGGIEVERQLGCVRGAAPGPTLVIVAGIHGHEPAGIHAARRVLAEIARDGIEIAGEITVLAGNVRSLARGKRFQRRDLNRQWSGERVALLPPPTPAVLGEDPESIEQRELHEAIDAAIATARGEVVVLDLHTTSAAGIPFALAQDTMRHRRFASELPIPALLGLEENIDGSLSEYMTTRGHISLVVEGGQHDSAGSIDNLAAAIWLAIAAAGLAPRERLPAWTAAHEHLDRVRGGLPRLIEVLYRHGIAPADEFRMEPGFANIQRVVVGTLLARDRQGDVRAPSSGLVLLPLYQSLGDDGFFFGREVPAWRQRLARAARRIRLDRALPLLPGVRREGHDDRLEVSTRAARFYPREIFQIFGYRRMRPQRKNGWSCRAAEQADRPRGFEGGRPSRSLRGALPSRR